MTQFSNRRFARFYSAIAISLLGLLLPQLVLAQPKVGLVLSGGGARGLAHIGVIKALEERNIRIDAIVGTSMGAIVGALYASGLNAAELEEIALTMEWNTAFSDQPQRSQLSFRRKQEAREYLTMTSATLNNGRLSLPKGIIQGQNLQLMLQRQFLHVSDIRDFDNLTIPFRAVASDLVSGDAVIFKEGALSTAVQASMSIPGLFAPVEMDGKMLVDGGIANNLPIDVVKAMGVDYVIAVDIATPLYGADELDSIIPIVEQLTTLLTFNQQKKQLALLAPTDLLVTPELSDISTIEFTKADIAIERGYQSMATHDASLIEFAERSPRITIPHRFIHDGTRGTYIPPVITEIQVKNNSEISDKLIRSHIHQAIGEPLNRAQLEEDLAAIYGYQYFESVHYELIETSTNDEASHALRITAHEKSWGRDLLGVSFELFTDNDGSNGYNLGLNYRVSDLTRKGGEWFNAAQFGEDSQIRTEMYLPLDYEQRFFTRPYASYSERAFNQVLAGEIESRFRIDDITLGVFLGTELSNKAVFGVGWEHRRGDTETFIGPSTNTVTFKDNVAYASLQFDSLDNLFFPHRGTSMELRFDSVNPGDERLSDFNLISLSTTASIPLGRHSIVLDANYVRSDGTVSGRHFQSSLGGFKKLSGFRDDALVGSDLAYLSVTYLHRLQRRDLLPVDLPVYIGVTIEAGNTWENHDNASFQDLIYGGALLMGVESPFGPIYFGYGRAEENKSAFYLKLGRIF